MYDSFVDTFFATKGTRSVRGFKSCQLFATEFGYLLPVLIDDKSEKNISLAIKRYFKKVGVPIKLICDQATEQVKGAARILYHESGCTNFELEKGSPASNRAERAVKKLKDSVKDDMFTTNSPLGLWYYYVERRTKVINSTVKSNYLLQNSIPHTKLTRQPTDISSLCQFGWYEWVIYRVDG